MSSVSTVTPWRILICDDVAEVHTATEYALRGQIILGRSLEFLHAYSAQQARSILESESNIAVILLDVVMENDHAGLDLINAIRKELNLQRIQIILQTGQPGFAPEREVVSRFSISAYLEKGHVLAQKLFSVVHTSLRVYQLLEKAEFNRRMAEGILKSNRQFLGTTRLKEYAESCMTQMATLLKVPAEGMVVARIPLTRDAYVCHVGTGKYEMFQGKTIAEFDDVLLRQIIVGCLEGKENVFTPEYSALFFPGTRMYDGVILLPPLQGYEEIDEGLVTLASENIITIAESISLVRDLTFSHLVDSLLSIPNRAALMNEIERRWELDELFSVLVLHIEEFDEANSLFGDQYGDRLLMAVSERLHTVFDGSYMIGRISGARFGIVGSPDRLTEEKMQAAFRTRILIDEVERPVVCTFGIAHVPLETPDDPDNIRTGRDLMRNAQLALKQAKLEGRGSYVTYRPEFGSLHRERAEISRNLRRALQTPGEITLMFQPQIDLQTMRCCGVEALVRWRQPDGTFIPPDRFIGIAEQSGQINLLGQLVLKKALEAARVMREQGHFGIRMAVNASTGQFRQAGFFDLVGNTLASTGTRPEDLELEVTESIAILGVDTFIRQLQAFRDAGIELAIDDFGTGYSSLSYLSILPVNRLKIDKAFVRTLENEQPGKRIAEIVISLARRMGLKVLAEGIENSSQEAILTQNLCDEGQGFFYSRPLTLENLITWLNDRLTAPALATP